MKADPSPTADAPWTVGRVIEWTTQHLKKHGSETPRLDTEILLAHARGCPRIQLYVQYNDVVTEPQRATMRDLVRRRAQSEPVAYLVGHREFFGLDFRVTADVLVPRPETETLVLELVTLAKSLAQPAILDIGAGSGAIAVAAAVQLPAARVTATDLSPAALQVASDNAERHGVAARVRFLQGDLFAPLAADELFDIIASNPPYVADDEMEMLPPDVRLHEPRSALAAGPRGLSVISRLIAEAPQHLSSGGCLLLEIAPEQSAEVRTLLESHSAYADVQFLKDPSGDLRVVRATAVA